MVADAPFDVIHSIPIWLGQTLPWIHTQMSRLPEPVRASVVCDRTENLGQFPWPRLSALSDTPASFLAWRATRLPWLHTRHLRGEIARTGARLVHSHFGPRGCQDLAAVRAAGVRHVVTFYGYDVTFVPRQHPSFRRRYRELFAAVDRVLCEGPFMAGSLAVLGCPEEKLRVQRLGVRLDALACEPRRRAPGEPLRVLIAASFREKKGIPDALAALGKIRGEVPLAVTLIGDATSEPRTQVEKTEILAAVDRFGLTGQVRLLGYQPHARFLEELRAHHVFLSPSLTATDGDSEGGAPVGLIEAVATGMPVVSTRHCDIPQVVEDGVTGWLADERDVDALAGHLLWLHRHPQAWAEMGLRARRLAEERFDADTQARALAAIYRELPGGQ